MSSGTQKMDDSCITKPSGLRRKASLNVTFCVKKEKSNNYKKIYTILQKSETDRTPEEKDILENSATVVQEANIRLEKRRRLKSRSEEIEDEQNVLEEKCRVLACALLNAQHLVVYSGAGVSTAARIPDYRGTNGIWTRLQQGKDIGCHDLSQAEPTLTHMALFALYRSCKLKHIVSQNCDGLHLRSGIPRPALSEVHGNMYLEVCTACKVEYWRLFDVTEHTGRYSHETARLCFYCRKPLRDTIVHFGERGALRWPLNWKGACRNADDADMILCIGSSLKVLKRYPWLWCMDKPVKKRPLLFIVNLQWTPKDDQATLKINGKCDQVMTLVMSHMGMAIPEYIRHQDPIFHHATTLHDVELHTTSQPILQQHKGLNDEHVKPFDDDLGVDRKVEFIDDDGDFKMDVVKEEVVVTSVHCDDETDSAIGGCDGGIDNSIESRKNDDCDARNKATKSVPDPQPHSSVVAVDDAMIKNLNGDLWRPFIECSLMEPIDMRSMPVPETNDLTNGLNNRLSQPNDILHAVFSNKLVPTNATRKPVTNNCTINSQGIFSNKILCSVPSVVIDSKDSILLQSVPLDLSSNKSIVSMTGNDQKPSFCQFCCNSYGGNVCQFYKQQISLPPTTPPFCYCCEDNDTEDDSVTDKEKDKDKEKEKDSNTDNKSKPEVTKVPIVNPGWFGKGYRKRTRKKR